MRLESDVARALSREFDRFRGEPFPHRMESAVGDDLKADLAAYDTHIAGVVASLAGGADAEAEDLADDSTLREHIEQLAQSETRAETRDGIRLLAYLDAITGLAAAAKRGSQ